MGNEHWIFVPLKQVVNAKKGKKPKTLKKSNFKNSIPYIDIEAFESGKIKQFADKSSSNQCKKTDILVVWDGARFGLAGFNQEGAIGSTITCLTPINVIPAYLFKFIQNQYKLIQQKPKGMATPHVDPEIFWNIEFPLAPLNEQKRIAEKLDNLLPRIKSAKARLEKIPVILKKFRQSVLAADCSGKLTEGTISLVSLSHITTLIKIGPFGTMLHEQDYINDGIPVINPKHIIDQNIFPDSNITVTKDKANELSAYKLFEDDILLGRRGEMGRVAPVTKKETGWLCGTGNIIIRLKKQYSAKLYSKILSGQNAINYLEQNAKGSTMKNLNEKITKNIPVPDFSEKQQQEIVSRVEKLFTLADSLKIRYQKALERLEKLEQAVLAKAFRGELAEPDPNDEPAEVLLERILKEKKK